ncbi:hypothetical protein WJX82_009912 [Trebouxia sp. C0006]
MFHHTSKVLYHHREDKCQSCYLAAAHLFHSYCCWWLALALKKKAAQPKDWDPCCLPEVAAQRGQGQTHSALPHHLSPETNAALPAHGMVNEALSPDQDELWGLAMQQPV